MKRLLLVVGMVGVLVVGVRNVLAQPNTQTGCTDFPNPNGMCVNSISDCGDVGVKIDNESYFCDDPANSCCICKSGWLDCNNDMSDGCEMEGDDCDVCGNNMELNTGGKCQCVNSWYSCDGDDSDCETQYPCTNCNGDNMELVNDNCLCKSGWNDCNKDLNDGCETEGFCTACSSDIDCGFCGSVCGVIPSGTNCVNYTGFDTCECVSGNCEIIPALTGVVCDGDNMEVVDGVCVCKGGWSDCNKDSSDGCESDVDCSGECVEKMNGDADGDGDVDIQDGFAWYQGYKKYMTDSADYVVEVDFDCDNAVNITDGFIWYQGYKAGVKYIGPPIEVPVSCEMTPVPDGDCMNPTLCATLGMIIDDTYYCDNQTESCCLTESLPTATPIPKSTVTPIPTSTSQGHCEKYGGSWITFDNLCADKCSQTSCGPASPGYFSCDCGDDECWVSDVQACYPNLTP